MSAARRVNEAAFEAERFRKEATRLRAEALNNLMGSTGVSIRRMRAAAAAVLVGFVALWLAAPQFAAHTAEGERAAPGLSPLDMDAPLDLPIIDPVNDRSMPL